MQYRISWLTFHVVVMVNSLLFLSFFLSCCYRPFTRGSIVVMVSSPRSLDLHSVMLFFVMSSLRFSCGQWFTEWSRPFHVSWISSGLIIPRITVMVTGVGSGIHEIHVIAPVNQSGELIFSLIEMGDAKLYCAFIKGAKYAWIAQTLPTTEPKLFKTNHPET